MPTVQVTVSEEELLILESILSNETAEAFASAALQEWIGWLNSSRRTTSMTELETERICTIYTHILENSLPSADAIGQTFNLPLGRAQYIVRNMKYKYPHLFRKRKAELISKALRDGMWTESRDTCIIEIDAGCQDLLDQTIKALLANGLLRSEVSGQKIYDKVRYELGSGHHEVLSEKFEAL